MEDVFDDEDMDYNENDLLEDSFFFLDEGDTPEKDFDDSDSDDDDMGKDELDGLWNEAEIKHFNAVLLEAQAMAVKAECKAAGKKPKHKRHKTTAWFDWPGSCLVKVKPEISQSPNITSQNGYKVES